MESKWLGGGKRNHLRADGSHGRAERFRGECNCQKAKTRRQRGHRAFDAFGRKASASAIKRIWLATKARSQCRAESIKP